MAQGTVVCGMACRVPGANNPSQLWENLIKKKDVQRQVPDDKYRFNVDTWWHPNHSNKGTINQKRAYFLDHPVTAFDAGFFGISGKEAESIDPQQRQLLEVAYEALEDAGITLDEIAGTQTAVFQGSLSNDYGTLLCDQAYYPLHSITGIGDAMQANRVSYFFNLKGPSIVVDTACSSSLIAFHLAHQSIISGESDYAIVLGSALYFDPTTAIVLSDMGFLSSDGRCRSFDADGSGYVRGEGVCAVVIKRQSDAIRDGNRIRCVVRTTGSNHDGTKKGLTVPSSEAQEEMIRRTYQLADLNPDDTQFFECHGTGTKVGDPNETRAVGHVFGTKTRSQDLVIGSIKSNIGHLEGAAGLAGLIKTVLAIEKGCIPPQMHFDRPNPDIKFREWRLKVPTETLSWPNTGGKPKRASLNSFGYGGANAHAVIESFEGATETPISSLKVNGAPPAADRPFLFPVTSHTTETGDRLKSAFRDYLTLQKDGKTDTPHLRDLAYTLSAHRTKHKVRSFAIAASTEELVAELQTPRASSEWTTAAMRSSRTTPQIGFIFTGQGAQSWDMGRQLIGSHPPFRATLDRCDAVLQSLPGTDRPEWSIVRELLDPKDPAVSRLSETRLSQPICTALQIALVDLLRAWGITPRAVCGHSSGEVAAAYCANILSFEAAMVVAYYRGYHMSQQKLSGTDAKPQRSGGMIAVGLTEADVISELFKFGGRLCLAAVNSSSSITISGDLDAIEEWQADLSTRGVFARKLVVQQAFHSHHMEPLGPAYEKALQECDLYETNFGKQAARMVSSVTSRVVRDGVVDAAYWVRNMVGTVRFADALTSVLLDDDEEQAVDILLEIGPHPALKGPSQQVASELKLDVTYLATLTRNRPAFDCLLDMAGQLFAANYPVDLVAVNAVEEHPGRFLIDLPTYSWNHRHYWTPTTRAMRNTQHRKHNHTLLGTPVPHSTPHTVQWRNYIRVSEIPWLAGHAIEGEVVFPGSGYLSLAVEAAVRYPTNEGKPISKVVFKDIDIKSAMTLRDNEVGTEMILTINPETTSAKSFSDEWLEFHISSFDVDERYSEHCHGWVSIVAGEAQAVELDRSLPRHPSVEELRRSSTNRPSCADLYRRLLKRGVQYREDFRLLKGDMDDGEGYTVANLEFNPKDYRIEDLDEVTLVPVALLDAVMHSTWSGSSDGWEWWPDEDGVGVPRSYKSVELAGHLLARSASRSDDLQKYTVRTFGDRVGLRTVISQLLVSDEQGRLCIHMQDQESTFLKEEQGSLGRRLYFDQKWEKSSEFDKIAPTVPTELTVVVSDTPSEVEADVLRQVIDFVGKPGQDRSLTTIQLGQQHHFEEGQSHIIVLASLSTDMASPDTFTHFQKLALEEEKNMVWVLQGTFLGAANPEMAKFAGFLRTARNENRLSRLVTLDLDPDTAATATSTAGTEIIRVLDNSLDEEELGIRGNTALVPRLGVDNELNSKLDDSKPSRQPLPDDTSVNLEIGHIGRLDTLYFAPNEDMLNNPLGPDQLEFKVLASALNFRDIAIAVGLIQDYHFGEECAGIVTKVGASAAGDFQPGDRIVVAAGECIASHARADAWLARMIPDGVGDTAAASFLTVTMTALYALHHVARLQAGDTILIHSAAGGVGQMAIQLAQARGARIFVTCSQGKRAFLKERFGFSDEQIFSSRDDSFKRDVLAATDGRGVDVVLNSLSGKLLEATWRCVAPFGRFVEIGKRDIHENSGLPMDVFRRNVSFSSIDMVLVVEQDRALTGRLIDEACKLVFGGQIQVPDSLLEVPFSDVERAFRLIQQGKHIGKVILVPGQGDVLLKPRGYHLLAKLFDPEKKYLIVGGLGGLGLKLAEWMYFKGARKLAFFTVSALSPTGELRESSRRTVDWLKERDCEIEIYRTDVANLEEVQQAFAKMGPVAGVFHLAMILADVSLQGMSYEQWEKVIRVKCSGAWNLHLAIQGHPMDFFACFSSISTIVGNPGQANYSAANAYLDSLMEWRRAQGHVGASINVAAVSSVGVAAELNLKFDETINPQELMLLVEEAILSDRRFCAGKRDEGRDLQIERKRLITGVSVDGLASNPEMSKRPLYRKLCANIDVGQSSSSAGAAATQSLAKTLAGTADVEERCALLTQRFMEKISAVMDVEMSQIDPANPPTVYGLDSIVAIELRKWVKTETRIDLPLFELLGGKAIKDLAAYIAAQIVITNDAQSSSTSLAPRTNGVTSTSPGNKVNGVKLTTNGISNGVNGESDAGVNGSVDADALLAWWRQYLADPPTTDPFAIAKAESASQTKAAGLGTKSMTPWYIIPANHVKRMKRICKQDLAIASPSTVSPSTPSGPFMFILGALWAYLLRCDGEQAYNLLLEVVLSGADAAAVPVRLHLDAKNEKDETTVGELVRVSAQEIDVASEHSVGLSREAIKNHVSAPASSNLAVRHCEENEQARRKDNDVDTPRAVLEVVTRTDGSMRLCMAFSSDAYSGDRIGRVMSGFVGFLSEAIRDHRSQIEVSSVSQL
ncbi:Type I Iterative PKS [Diaporthe australafricana]|uniref:Type I Iterative PKS n=1 Tax=Diaporthe australafricana TaxID=127596 RepID=A0ABR3W299_9PEZI